MKTDIAYGAVRTVGGFWRRLKAAGFWLFMGASVSYASVLYAGPTHIQWNSRDGFVADIQYEDELRSQMRTLTRTCKDDEGNKVICPPPKPAGEE